jgi:cell wall-associated NlpC family hydrolase
MTLRIKYSITVTFCLFLIGCSSSSPRFGSGETSTKKEKHEKKQTGPRFTSKHVEEEKKEDDKKVDIASVSGRFTSKPAPFPSSGPSKPNTAHSKEESAVSPQAVQRKLNDQKMMDVILGYLGTPYQYGGETKDGIDCSAFTRQVYEQAAKMSLPRTTTDQVKHGSIVGREEIKFGDLLFFNTTGTNPSHVGIYIGDDLFAHASEAFGVTISSLQSSYYKKRWTESRRVSE